MNRGRAAVLAAVLALAGLVAGCGGGGDSEALALDGSPRQPDRHGLLEAVDDDGVTVGGRTYRFADGFRSFSTYTLKLEPVRNREGQFVHVGLDGDRVTWLAGFAAPLPTEPPTVPYLGTVRSVEEGAVTFLDGSVLPLADGVEEPQRDAPITVSIDPSSGEIVEWRLTE